MKKITFLLSFFMLVGISLNAQVNLVVNPSFEDGFNGWTKGPSSSYNEPTVKTDGAQDGTSYANYAAPSGTTGFYQEISVTANKTYKLSFWYKATGDDSDARLWSFLLDADGNRVYTTESPTTDPLRTNNEYLAPASDWTKHELTFDVPATVVKLQLAVRAYRGDAVNVSYDNFSLVEEGGSTTTPGIVVNSSSLNFNSPVGTPTAEQSVTVTATSLSAAPTYNISGADAAMFSATGNLTTNGGTISVIFNPTSEGTKSAVLTISQDGISKQVALTGVVANGANPYGLDDSAPATSLFENFESVDAIPAGWVNYAAQGDRNWEHRTFQENKYVQMSAHKGSGVYQNLLISPAIDFDNLSKKEMKFDWNSGYANGATLTVSVMSKDGTMTEVKSINAPNSSGWGTFATETVDLSAFSGVKFIVFEYNGDADPNNLKTTTYQIDNIKVPSNATGLATSRFDKLSIWTRNNQLMFNATANEMIEVYNITGQKIVNQLSSDGLNEVYVPCTGVMIVKVGNCVGKVIL